MGWSGWFALLGIGSLGLALWVLGRLSQKLGRVTHARPYYIGHYAGAVFVWLGLIPRLLILLGIVAVSDALHQNTLWILIYHGPPVLGVTIGILMTWYYWSWLLAERD